MTPLNQTKDSILLDEFNDFFFDSKTMVQEANDILSEEVRTGRMISGEYNSEVWAFICDTRHTMVTISFLEVSEPLSFFEEDNELFVSVIKCWIATLIPKYSIETIKKYYSNFKKFLILSHNFNESLHDDVELFLLHKCTDRQRWSICVAILNFLDFYEIEEHQSYKKMLIDVKSDINMDNIVGSVRSLPAAKDVLAFSWVIENYFLTLETDDINYLKYYPIYLWWEISNLIPMRPSEFCGIARTSLSKKDNRIQLPRI